MILYRITSPHFVAGLITNGDIIIQAAPILGWTVTKDFSYVRDYCRKKGWSVEPIEDEQPSWLEIDGLAYEFTWKGDTLSCISLHEDGEVRELGYDELPEQLKELL